MSSNRVVQVGVITCSASRKGRNRGSSLKYLLSYWPERIVVLPFFPTFNSTFTSGPISHSIKRHVSARYLLLGRKPIVSPPGAQPVLVPRGPIGRTAVPNLRSGASF